MDDATAESRRDAVADLKRELILRAALEVFATDGLEGASMRAIAKQAGYTPGAIYQYFPSKEHIYAAALRESLHRLETATVGAAAGAKTPADRFEAAGLAFYDFYRAHPRDLDLGFYLFRGGMQPRGLSPGLDLELNAGLLATLDPMRRAARDAGRTEKAAAALVADAFAHASGLLLLEHTGRLGLFPCSGRDLMRRHLRALTATMA
jgi:AcrR family transcriptional regulator